MRCFALALYFVAVICTVKCYGTNHGEEIMTRLKLKYLEAYLQERQAIDQLTSRLEVVCPGSKQKFEDAIDEMKKCADEIDETKETSCSIVQNRMPKCIKPIVEVLKDCMPEQSKAIPEFFLKAILKSVDYICKTDGEHIFELGNTCLYAHNPLTQNCKRKFVMKMKIYEKNGFGVEDVCSLMQYMKPCLKSHLISSCGSPITQEAVLGVWNAFMSGCKSIADPSSNELKETKDIEIDQLENLS